jgi:transcription antitermination factor NusG
MFTGLSSLRKPEKKELTERDKQLQAYLASKYGGDDGHEQQEAAPKKKKKKKPKAAVGSAVRIVEGDVSGFAEVTEAVPRPLKREEEDADDGEHSSMLPVLMHVVAVARTDRHFCFYS